MPHLLLKEHIRDPETLQTYLRGPQEVDDAIAYRLKSAHPDLVEDVEELAGARKSEVVAAAEDAGVPVEGGETKEEVARKLGAKKR